MDQMAFFFGEARLAGLTFIKSRGDIWLRDICLQTISI